MLLLKVWLTLADGKQVQVGELAFTEPDSQGGFESEFAYRESWLSDPGVFSLDPESLPLDLGMNSTRSKNLFPPLAVFEDALPDSWGRQLLIAEHMLSRGHRGEPYLLRALGANGLGALRFSEQGMPCAVHHPPSTVMLGELVTAAEQYEAGCDLSDERIRRLLAAGSSPGGARPKVLVNSADGRWIAKLPSRNDGRFDIVGLEAATMRTACHAGLEVPDTRLLHLENRKVLLVRRFDVTEAGGRRHVISLRTLCKEQPGRYSFGYSEIANVVRKHSSRPVRDVSRLYKQMIFNAVVGNTDDHLKNFWLYHDDAGWQLTPAFDLVPDVGEQVEHTLMFNLSATPPPAREFYEVAKAWGVPDCKKIAGDVVKAAPYFARYAAEALVPKENIRYFRCDIERRLEVIGFV